MVQTAMSARPPETLLSSLSVLGASRAAVLCMNLATTSHLARTLDASNFGINSFAVSLVAYFMIVVNLGLETFVTRSIAYNRSRITALVESMLSLRLLLACVMFLALLGSVFLLSLNTLSRSVVLIQSVNLFSSAFGLTCAYQGLNQMRMVAAREFAASLIAMVGVYVLVRGPDDVLLAAATTATAMLLTNLAVLVQYGLDFGRPRLRVPDRSDLAQAQASMSYFWSALMITITYNMHLVLLGLLRSDAEVGLFSVGWKLFNFATVVPNLIAAIILPRIAHATEDLVQRAHTAEVGMRVMIVCAVPITMLGEALVPQIVMLLFGRAYLPATPAAALLLLNALVVAVNIGFGTPLTAVGRQSTLLRVATIGTSVGVALNLVLIPSFGVLGASVGTLVDEALILGLLAVNRPEVPLMRVLVFGLRCLLAVTPASLAAHWLVNQPGLAGSTLSALAVAGAAGGLIYVALLRLLRIGLVEFATTLVRL